MFISWRKELSTEKLITTKDTNRRYRGKEGREEERKDDPFGEGGRGESDPLNARQRSKPVKGRLGSSSRGFREEEEEKKVEEEGEEEEKEVSSPGHVRLSLVIVISRGDTVAGPQKAARPCWRQRRESTGRGLLAHGHT